MHENLPPTERFGQAPYSPPPKRKNKTRGCLIGAAIFVGLLAIAVGCTTIVASVNTSGEKATVATPPPAASDSPSSSPDSKPTSSDTDVRYRGTCDLDLGDSLDGSDYSFTSEVELKNESNAPARVLVMVSWPQYGYKPIGDGKVVTVKANSSKTVQFAKHATQDQISRAQSYQLKHGGMLNCKYKAFVR